MRCFRVSERIRRGLLIHSGYDEEAGQRCPYIPAPDGCSMKLLLDEGLTQGILACPPELLRLSEARIEFADGLILLRPPPKRHDKQALVRVETAAGAGGSVCLTSGSYTATLVSGAMPRVYPKYHPFPDAGVIHFCTKEMLQRVNQGVDCLDVLMLMHPGARCRVQRNGQLEGGSPWMDLKWTGDTLVRKYEGGEERCSGRIGESEPYPVARALLEEAVEAVGALAAVAG